MTVKILCNVASVIAVEDEVDRPRMLLLKRATGDLKDEWCHIAGKIEHGETAWQTALRELKEETGFIPHRFYSADYSEQFYEHQRNVVEIIPAFVAFVDPGSVPRLNAEHSEYRWVSFSEAASLVVFGGMRRLYEEVEREFVLRHPSKWHSISVG
jgi:dATP pyrophosphohydrolase